MKQQISAPLSVRSLLQEGQAGILYFGGARMALLDIEVGFRGLRRQTEALVGRDGSCHLAGRANGGASFALAFATNINKAKAVALQKNLVT